MQEPALTTREARATPWSLLTSLSSQGTATGELYLDDGESLYPNATLRVQFQATNNKLTAMARGNWKETNPLSKVTVLGVSEEPHNVTFNGQAVPASDVNYNATSHVLSVCDLQVMTADGAFSKPWTLKW
jgi:alpha-glucosidase